MTEPTTAEDARQRLRARFDAILDDRWPLAGKLMKAVDDYRQQDASALREAALKAHRFIGGVTSEQWAAIYRLREAEDTTEAIDRALAALPPSAPPGLTRDDAIDGWLRLYGGTDTDVAADVGRFYDEVIVPALATLPPSAPPGLDVPAALRKVRENLTAYSGPIDYNRAMICVETVEAEYARLEQER